MLWLPCGFFPCLGIVSLLGVTLGVTHGLFLALYSRVAQELLPAVLQGTIWDAEDWTHMQGICPIHCTITQLQEVFFCLLTFGPHLVVFMGTSSLVLRATPGMWYQWSNLGLLRAKPELSLWRHPQPTLLGSWAPFADGRAIFPGSQDKLMALYVRHLLYYGLRIAERKDSCKAVYFRRKTYN